MYAIIATGGKQYKVQENGTVNIEKIAGEVGSDVNFDKVLLVGNDGDIKVGKPFLSGVKVNGQIVAHDRADKILVFKKKRRKGYKKIQGHRQSYTAVKVIKINNQ